MATVMVKETLTFKVTVALKMKMTVEVTVIEGHAHVNGNSSWRCHAHDEVTACKFLSRLPDGPRHEPFKPYYQY